MISNPFALNLVDGNTLLIDNSTLERFVTCPRSAQFYMCYRKELNRDRPALTFGTIAHEILAVRYLSGDPVFTDDILRQMHGLAASSFATYIPPNEDFRNYSAMTTLIDEYQKTYPAERFTVLQLGNGNKAVEIPFAFPLGSLHLDADLPIRIPGTDQVEIKRITHLNVVWTGRIDLIYNLEGRTYFMDHKTTAIMGPSFFSQFELSHQMIGYAWAVKQIIGLLPTACVINAIGVRKPTKTGKALEFQRATIQISAEHVQEFETDTIHIVSDFISMVRRSYLPKHTKWCDNKYGPCEYKQVCLLPSASREMMLSTAEYRNVTWSPLH